MGMADGLCSAVLASQRDKEEMWEKGLNHRYLPACLKI